MTSHLRARIQTLSLLGLVILAISSMVAGGCQCDNHLVVEPITEAHTPEAHTPDAQPTPEIRDAHPLGRKCAHLCDCKQGEDCEKGLCVVAPGLIPVYCCSNPGCTFGQKCFHRDGRESVCTEGTSCSNDGDCQAPTCQNEANHCVQIDTRCTEGQCLATRTMVNDAICGAGGKCVPPTAACKVHCDCGQGLFCNNGNCQIGDNPVYCCRKPGCPAKSACYQDDDSVGNCAGAQCKQDIDCGPKSCSQQGSFCKELQPTCQADGSCTSVTRQGTGSCNSSTGTCRLAQPCRTHCDCDQVETCVQGACAPLSSRQTFCCSKAGCPKGMACFTEDGAPGVCPAPHQCKVDADCPARKCRDANDGKDCIEESSSCNTAQAACVNATQLTPNARCDNASGRCLPTPPDACKVDCDCPQTMLCSAGSCLSGTQAVYCCSKAGCPNSASCTKSDGTNSTCGAP